MPQDAPFVVKVEFAPEKLCASMQKFGEDFDDEVARRLGSALFPPETLARLGPRFAVILPRCAHAFPVAAVRVGTGRLVDRAVVSIAPDVSTVSQPEEGRSAGVHGRALVLADPLFDLPFARVEARWTGQATRAEVRLGASATAGALEPSGGRLLHFATHSVVDVSGPALELAGEQAVRRRDSRSPASCRFGRPRQLPFRLETRGHRLGDAFDRISSRGERGRAGNAALGGGPVRLPSRPRLL